MPRWWLWGLVALGLWAAQARGAEPLSTHTLRLKAEASARALDFDKVVIWASEALAQGGASLEDTRALYALLAPAQAVLNQTDAAERSFRVLLELEPGFSLPPGSSPKVELPLFKAKAALSGASLTLDTATAPHPDGSLTTTARWRSDVNALVRGARVMDRERLFEAPALRPGASETEIAWRCSLTPCPFRVDLLDGVGNVLGSKADEDVPRIAPRPWIKRPAPWLVAAGAVLAGAAVAGVFYGVDQHEVLAMRADKAGHSFPDYVSTTAHRDAAATVALVGGGLALGLGAVGLAFW